MKIDCLMHEQVTRGIDPYASMLTDDTWVSVNNKSGTGSVRMYSLDKTYMVIAKQQDESILDHGALLRDNISVVKRKRGGGALLIGKNDFVISVSIGKELFSEESKGLRVFLEFNRMIKLALANLGVNVTIEREGAHPKTHACFNSVNRGEMLDDQGRKVFGGDYTGQPHKNGYFQYGFVPLSADHDRALDYIKEGGRVEAVPAGLSSYNIAFADMVYEFTKVMHKEHPEWRR